MKKKVVKDNYRNLDFWSIWGSLMYSPECHQMVIQNEIIASALSDFFHVSSSSLPPSCVLRSKVQEVVTAFTSFSRMMEHPGQCPEYSLSNTDAGLESLKYSKFDKCKYLLCVPNNPLLKLILQFSECSISNTTRKYLLRNITSQY